MGLLLCQNFDSGKILSAKARAATMEKAPDNSSSAKEPKK